MDPLATGRPDESAAPILLEQPEDAFVVKSKPATLSCRAAHALQLYFVCNGEAVRQKHHSQHEFVDPMTGIRQLEVKADISRNDVEEYFGSDGYGCECIAWSSFGQVKSRRAKVIVACKSTVCHYFPFSRAKGLSRLEPSSFRHVSGLRSLLSFFFFVSSPLDLDAKTTAVWWRNGRIRIHLTAPAPDERV